MTRIIFLLVLSSGLLMAIASGAESQGAAGGTAGASATPPTDAEAALAPIMQQWARIKYELAADDQADAYERLAEQAKSVSERFPERAEPKVWEAIVRASYAGAMGGVRSLFGALPQVTRARDLLLEAERIDAYALDGSVYTSLGSLYYQVPGSPIGFGDDELARQNLERAVAISPHGIDPNYFLGDYWKSHGEPAKARTHLERALRAPDRPGREIADMGRRREIRAALRELDG